MSSRPQALFTIVPAPETIFDDKTAEASPSVAELAFARVLAALPKYLDKSRVTMATGLAASQLRVSLDGRLVSHLAHSVYGWTPWESGMGHAYRESAAVTRAIRKATKDGGK